jgi:uncharacterized Zn finger protein
MRLQLAMNRVRGFSIAHNERIKCPECMKNCEAEVVRAEPWYVYVHECEHCGHIITESEWETIKNQ